MRILTPMSANHRDAFVSSASHWMSVITAKLPTVTISPGIPAGSCGAGTPAFSGSVPNLIIFVQAVSIDGPGEILGSASPCIRRLPDYLTAIGAIRLDVADLGALEASGRLEGVIRHEMAHVLGFGTSWVNKGLVSGIGGSDPVYTGAAALALWPTFNMGYSGTPLPLETTGGVGTRDAHWRQSVWENELMVGYASAPGVPRPMSRMTIAVLQDFGYAVDYGTAESYRSNLMAGMMGASSPPGMQLKEELEGARFEVGSDGVLKKIVPSPAEAFLRRP
jgi:hypothetical protein